MIYRHFVLSVAALTLAVLAACEPLASAFAASGPASGGRAAAAQTRPTARTRSVPARPAALGLSLSATPAIVDVGNAVTLTLTARQWTPHSTVIARFLSPHHGFSGTMPWDPRCGCFRLAISLAKRIHGLEQARATAIVTAGTRTSTVFSNFQIRGLAPGGRTYAPGGTPMLSVWVGDPSPVATEYQHYCVWVHTSDSLGVAGLRVKFSVHFATHVENWTAGVTSATGVVCTRRSVGHPQVGVPVLVNAYAGSLQAQTSFTPRG